MKPAIGACRIGGSTFSGPIQSGRTLGNGESTGRIAASGRGVPHQSCCRQRAHGNHYGRWRLGRVTPEGTSSECSRRGSRRSWLRRGRLDRPRRCGISAEALLIDSQPSANVCVRHSSVDRQLRLPIRRRHERYRAGRRVRRALAHDQHADQAGRRRSDRAKRARCSARCGDCSRGRSARTPAVAVPAVPAPATCPCRRRRRWAATAFKNSSARVTASAASQSSA